MNYELEELKIEIKDRFQEFINSGELEDAKLLLEEYKSIVKDDIEIYSMMSILNFLYGELEEAEKILKSGLLIEENNFDLLYNLAIIYEEKEEYLEAIEIYEKIIFNLEDNQLRSDLIKHLNTIEHNNKDTIEKQLKEKDIFYEETLFKGKKKNLHLMYDSPYCEKLIEVLEKDFSEDNNLIVMIHSKNEEFKYISKENISRIIIIDLNQELLKLIEIIENSSRIFIHYLFDYFCILINKFNIKKNIYWPIWGGDLYNYIDFEMYKEKTKSHLLSKGIKVNEKIDKNNILYIYRKATVRKIKNILVLDEVDYKRVKDNFITKAERIDFMYFPPTLNNLDTKKVDLIDELKLKYHNIFLVGNSANMSNNHIDIFNELKNLKTKDFCVLAPLSYGGESWYLDHIIKEGRKLFGDRFIPITNYYDKEEYSYILKNIDVALFAYNRQQGLGNMWSLLLEGKKMYIDNEKYKFFDKSGIKVYNICELSEETLKDVIFIPKDIKENNIKIAKKIFNEDNIKMYLKKIFLN